MVTKQQIKDIVDGIDDESVLEQVYEILSYIRISKNDNILENLSLIQKEKVNMSYEQSLDDSKLVLH